MIAVDSSVAIAAFASWHDGHELASKVLDEGPRLVGHAAMETYSVLTRLPPPHRVQHGLVAEYIRRSFPEEFLMPSAEGLRRFVDVLATNDIKGGASYDALIACTAAQHDAELVTADSRATPIYRSLGVRTRFVGS